MPTSVDVSIWGWRLGDDLSVGHVMLTDAASQDVFLSQFPANHSFEGQNTKFTYEQTYSTEGRPPDVVYRIAVPNGSAFASQVANEVARPTWCWDPEPPTETHCARSSYDALNAGLVLIDPACAYVIQDGERNENIPNRLWQLIEDAPGVAQTVQPGSNLDQPSLLKLEREHAERARQARLTPRPGPLTPAP